MAVWKKELSPALARASLDRIPSAIAILDRDGSLLYANPRFLQRLGSLSSSIDLNDIRIESAPLNRFVSADHGGDEEFEVSGPGGEHIFLRGSSLSIPDTANATAAVLVMLDSLPSHPAAARHGVSISERIARLRTFSSSLARAVTLATVADAIVNEGRIAADGHSSVLAVMNQDSTALEVFRYTDSARMATATPGTETPLPPMGDLELGVCLVVRGIEEASAVYPPIVPYQLLTGENTWTIVALQADQSILGIWAISIADDTAVDEEFESLLRTLAAQAAQALDRVRLYEAERRSRQEAERANRSKDEFLATLSHELRTPTTVILGWAGMLRRDGGADPELVSLAAESIESTAQAQAQLVFDLLDISRIVAGKMHVELQPLDLNSLLVTAVRSVRATADARGLALRLEIPDERTFVMGDPNRLQQIVWNLLSNAMKFTDRGGEVSVRLERSNSGGVVLSVADTGRGIPAEFLPQIFARFSQGDPLSTRVANGLGLGLAIVKHFVELHGGLISVRSEGPGKGSTFTVELPAASENAAEKIPERWNSSDQGALDGVKVLVLEDDDETRKWIASVLQRSGAKPTTARTMLEALSLFDHDRPDLVLSDIRLPGEDAWSLVARLHERCSGSPVPVLALTGLARDEDRKRILSAGFEDYLQKPIGASELVRAVRPFCPRPTQG